MCESITTWFKSNPNNRLIRIRSNLSAFKLAKLRFLKSPSAYGNLEFWAIGTVQLATPAIVD
jgi:hypothetical protein